MNLRIMVSFGLISRLNIFELIANVLSQQYLEYPQEYSKKKVNLIAICSLALINN